MSVLASKLADTLHLIIKGFRRFVFLKIQTSDGVRISASKTISKDFLEIVLYKSVPNRPRGKPHYTLLKNAATD